MPPSYLMRDVIVCIPGITGSVLRKDGKDIWNVSGGAILNALRTLGGSVKELKLEEDPVDADDVDGITGDLGDPRRSPHPGPLEDRRLHEARPPHRGEAST